LPKADALPPAVLWLRRADQVFLGVCTILTVVLLSAHWVHMSGWSVQPIEIDRLPARQYDYRLDINTATYIEWVQLEGIGPALAQAIVDDREAKGPFRSIADLDRVKGIGPKTIERLRPSLREPGEVEPKKRAER
jgi:competence protein ComEA